jgi:S1-C subfamily serine protease
MDGQEIATPQDLSAAMNAHRAGDTVTVTVFRGRKKLDVKVILGDAKDNVRASEGQQT